MLRETGRPEAVPRVLWIGRYMPYPMDAGAKVYSGKLAESLAQAGTFVRFLGFGDVHAAPPESPVEWVAVPSEKRNQVVSLLSPLPIAAAVDATRGYKSLLDAQLREHWDAIVIDGYGSGWALARCHAYRAAHLDRSLIVHVSHNHEEVLWRSMAAQARGSLPKRAALWQNALKVRALERRLVRGVDLLTAITDEDSAALAATAAASPLQVHRLTLTPGHEGWIAQQRCITATTQRRVIIVGSFRWVMKQENLTRFVEIADPVFKQHNIELDVVGDVPDELLATLKSRCAATCFHGFVDDIADFFARARIAVVPELIGGGFKLKFLDYIFARVPTATLTQAAAGIPAELQREMLLSDDLPGLVASIVAHMDRLDDLNRMQERAFACGQALFRWSERGQRLRQAIVNVQHARARDRTPATPKALGVPTS